MGSSDSGAGFLPTPFPDFGDFPRWHIFKYMLFIQPYAPMVVYLRVAMLFPLFRLAMRNCLAHDQNYTSHFLFRQYFLKYI